MCKAVNKTVTAACARVTFFINMRLTFPSTLLVAGEHRESGEDGADHQRVAHSQQQMGSDLLPVQREDRSVHTGERHTHTHEAFNEAW